MRSYDLLLFLRLLALFLWSAVSTNAASPMGPPDFADVRWEASVLEAREVILKRTGIALSEERPDRLTFTGGTFANIGVDTWQLDFTNGKFTKGTVRLNRIDEQNEKGWINDQTFNSTCDVLEKKYGKSIKLSNAAHAEKLWEFRDSFGAATSIRFYYSWSSDRRFDIIYSYDRSPPPATSKPNAGKLKRGDL